MFGIGMPEMILILVVALIVIGPKKLPDLAKSLGKAMGEFKKATRELKDSFEIDDEINGMKKSLKDFENEMTSSIKIDDEEKSSGKESAAKENAIKDDTPADNDELVKSHGLDG